MDYLTIDGYTYLPALNAKGNTQTNEHGEKLYRITEENGNTRMATLWEVELDVAARKAAAVNNQNWIDRKPRKAAAGQSMQRGSRRPAPVEIGGIKYQPVVKNGVHITGAHGQALYAVPGGGRLTYSQLMKGIR